MSKERIGILGGTFNPIHVGHIAMARAAMKSAKLDRVIFMPDGIPPHKFGIAPAEARYHMVCAAIAKEVGFEPCRMEMDRTGITYTVDTLADLHQLYPSAALYYIIGADTLMQLHCWHEMERLPGMCTFLVCPRTLACTQQEYEAEWRRLSDMGIKLEKVTSEVMPVSSTEVRAALAANEPTATLLPVPVQEYCHASGLYGLPQRIPQAASWFEQLAKDLSAKRFAHTLAVADCAVHLAKIHGVDPYQAEVAALLHDCAKCLPLAEMRQIAVDHALTTDETLLESTNLLHAIVGSYLAKASYGVEDTAILHAIASHTTGCAKMRDLDMIVYLSDKIEATRAPYPTLASVRDMAPVSLEKAMLLSLRGTADHVRKGGKPLHPQTLATISWLENLAIN